MTVLVDNNIRERHGSEDLDKRSFYELLNLFGGEKPVRN